LALVFIGLRTAADARYLIHFGFAPRCAKLRSFAGKNFQTVEQTVKIPQQTISESAVGVWAEIASSTPGVDIMAAHLLALVLDCIQFIVEM
jgi:hypothetical protein